jgi:aspartyl-tRNA(Asn)/glutamyl-tRNA(Gln) amidotransferase subunit B
MITKELRSKYRPTIGIECHVQLKTTTKLFSSVNNDAREAPPNTLVSHICFGLPGALPVLNEEAIRLAARAGFALGTTPQKFSKFDRKHYFYPDLPKGYQITQYDQPIVIGGQLILDVEGEEQTIGITRAHMEEDAGKSTHPEGSDFSLVDLNRAGTPLIEIVTEPDIHSSAGAKAVAKELYLRMKYAGVSEANLYYGNMRFDVNVSVSKDPEVLGTRSETKNLNSFKAVEKAVEFEVDRQIELIEKGESIVQETRGWNDAKQKTFSQRTKEDAHDYRYFPDPDLPPILLDDAFIEKIRSEMPVMPDEWRKRLKELDLNESNINTLLEAEVEDDHVSYLTLLEDNLANKDIAKFLANWYVNVHIPLQSEGKIKLELSTDIARTMYLAIYELSKQGKLSSTKAKELITNLLSSNELPSDIEAYAQDNGYIQVSDEAELVKVVDQVLADNPKAAEDVMNGEMKAIGFLVGQIMKASQGKANPGLAQNLIKKQLNL